MDFSNIEIKIKDGLTTLKIDGVDFPTVTELDFHVKTGEPPTLNLKLYCADFNK